MRPVLAGLCRYESLKGTDLDLLDIAIMNEALDVQQENYRRMEEYLRRAR